MEKPPFTLGTVGHFGLSVGMKEIFEFAEGVAVSSDEVTIALHKGRPSPSTLGERLRF